MEARSPAQHVNDTPQGPGIDMLVDQQTKPFYRVISITSDGRVSFAGAGRTSLLGDVASTRGSCAGSNMRNGTNVAVGGGAAISMPSRTCRRQVNTRPGYRPCCAATSVTRAPASFVSPTIRSLS
jgi:hypothetical protein